MTKRIFKLRNVIAIAICLAGFLSANNVFAQAVTLTLDPQGGTVTPTSISANYGVAIGTLPTPIRTGYTFGGWYSQPNGAGTQYTANSTLTANATAYARWTASTYTVTFDRQSGTGGSASVTATYGAAMPTATAPTRTGYTFAGYYTQQNGAGTQYYTATMASARNCDLTSATTLYASWTIQSYTLTFDPQGGTVTPTSISANSGVAIGTLPTPNRTGYTFEGWYSQPNGAGTQYTANSTLTANATAYAKWNIINYNIDYKLDGGSNHPSNPLTYTIEDNVILHAPTKNNFDFDGWEEGNEIPTGSTGAKTFTAIWISTVVTGIIETAPASTLKIYPNPTADGNFNIVLNSETAVLTIFNSQGQIVFTTKINRGFSSISTNLGAGVYVVSVQFENKVNKQKLIIDK